MPIRAPLSERDPESWWEKDRSPFRFSPHGPLLAPPTLAVAPKTEVSGLCLAGEGYTVVSGTVTAAAPRKRSRWVGKNSEENAGPSGFPWQHFQCPDLGKAEPLSLVSLKMPRCLRAQLTSASLAFSISLSPCFLQQGLRAALFQPHPQRFSPIPSTIPISKPSPPRHSFLSWGI